MTGLQSSFEGGPFGLFAIHSLVIPGLVPGIQATVDAIDVHAFDGSLCGEEWISGTRPGMTIEIALTSDRKTA
jgi:hypothetical protein